MAPDYPATAPAPSFAFYFLPRKRLKSGTSTNMVEVISTDTAKKMKGIFNVAGFPSQYVWEVYQSCDTAWHWGTLHFLVWVSVQFCHVQDGLLKGPAVKDLINV